MNITTTMILIRGEDKTAEIESFSHDSSNKKVIIRFSHGSKSYSYSEKNVSIFENPAVIELGGRTAYVDNMPIYEPESILDFGERIRIIQYNGVARTVMPDSFSIVENGAGDANARQILEYFREIAKYTTNSPDEDAFLKQEMDRLTFIHPESVLGRYLAKKPIESRDRNRENIIFPFSFNLSQKTALEQALTNSVSVIEGPPGTGKTQTILNILANLTAVQKKSVAVVSNNNEAVKNVIEKLERKHYDFLAALLGKKENQEAFFSSMPVPEVEGWDCEETEEDLFESIRKWNTRLTTLMNKERRKAELEQEIRAWKMEQEHFEAYFNSQDVEAAIRLPLLCRTPEKILKFLAETTIAQERQQTEKILYRLKLFFKYGVFSAKRLKRQEVSVLLTMQRRYYQLQIQRLEQQVTELNWDLKEGSFEDTKKKHQETSEKLFRKYLYKHYHNRSVPDFTKKNYKVRFSEFMEFYPILLSTTYALRRSIPQNYLLDYVIIDESSQVDLITGALAFSCCRNVIIVGDLKQLPQITDSKIKDRLTVQAPGKEYDYFSNSILSSVMAVYGEKLPSVTLREHYRCHPRIIEFCNQKYYQGQLIAYTKAEPDDCPLILYKTAEGNHMRRVNQGERKGVYNQREIDVIVEEILQNPLTENRYEDIGLVTPFRKQADKAAALVDSRIESDTVHKYQGREKNTMIMSTVLDSSGDARQNLAFVDDPQMVNVAVSRAIKQFILVTDHSLFFKNGEHIGDLIRYMQYNTLDENVIESQIVSVFDLLYQRYSERLLPLKAKMNEKVHYQSEEALRVLLEEILQQPDFSRYGYSQGVLLQNLLKDTTMLSAEEESFVRNRASLDFVVFYKQDKSCILVIEVDGFAFHENHQEQLRRDAMKDSILQKYRIPFLRLATNGSREREKIEEMLKGESGNR